MEAVVVAMGILMWTWGDASLRLVQALLAPAAGTTRSAWLALAIALGAGALVALAQLVLPGSVLSQGWSRETLQAAQSWTLGIVLLAGLLALVRGHRQLSPRPQARPLVARPPARASAAAPASPAAPPASVAPPAPAPSAPRKPGAAPRPAATGSAPAAAPRKPGATRSPRTPGAAPSAAAPSPAATPPDVAGPGAGVSPKAKKRP